MAREPPGARYRNPNPFIFHDTEKARSLGWEPKLTVPQSAEKVTDSLLANLCALAARV